MWSAAAAVTCAAVGLSGSIAANATTTKAAPAAQAATNPVGDKNKFIPYPRLDSANIVTAFTVAATGVTPTTSTTFTGSARRGRVFVNDGTGWADLTTVFGGYLYDITLAPSPSTALSVVPGGGALTSLSSSGIPVGRVRVTVRRADGAILFSDCSVSTTSGTSALPLTSSRCSAPTRL
ncbi:hypothetical protein [Microbispora sp. GKU 823]|uniref:hypothetical protein n=1 Tax=Microbispora sp. GKU 823 TaxID=1652100 RepID=UPI0009A30CD0|nr:hypothetical protein [Microbispora sp. GKU 823]OPG12037.1 hypothetical protein B1L11_16910 [Microbispora sp. GKU 823]